MAVLMMQLERDKYAQGIGWLHDLLRNTTFTTERVCVIANKMANDVARIKRKGNKMALAIMRDLVFNGSSNHYSSSLIRQQKFLERLIASPEGVVETLTSLRDLMTSPDVLSLHMAADIDSLPDLKTPWMTQMFRHWVPSPAAESIPDGLGCLAPDHQLLRDDANASGMAIALGSVESSFLIQTVRSISDPEHPDLAAILVALQYLGQLEGPFWRQLRAQGLVYGYNLNLKVSEGLLYLSLYRASHPVMAYKEARIILENHASNADMWEDSLLQSARSSLIFELVEREKTVGDVVAQSVRSYLNKTSVDYHKRLIDSVAVVTMDQMQQACRVHLMPLLDSSKSCCSVICHPSKLDEIVTGVNALGQSVQRFTSIDESPLSQLI